MVVAAVKTDRGGRGRRWRTAARASEAWAFMLLSSLVRKTDNKRPRHALLLLTDGMRSWCGVVWWWFVSCLLLADRAIAIATFWPAYLSATPLVCFYCVLHTMYYVVCAPQRMTYPCSPLLLSVQE